MPVMLRLGGDLRSEVGSLGSLLFHLLSRLVDRTPVLVLVDGHAALDTDPHTGFGSRTAEPE
jgi:hypothetical protein